MSAITFEQSEIPLGDERKDPELKSILDEAKAAADFYREHGLALSPKQVCVLANVHPSTVSNMIARGHFTFLRLPLSGMTLIPVNEAKAYAEARRQDKMNKGGHPGKGPRLRDMVAAYRD